MAADILPELRAALAKINFGSIPKKLLRSNVAVQAAHKYITISMQQIIAINSGICFFVSILVLFDFLHERTDISFIASRRLPRLG